MQAQEHVIMAVEDRDGLEGGHLESFARQYVARTERLRNPGSLFEPLVRYRILLRSIQDASPKQAIALPTLRAAKKYLANVQF
jgi:hypothetical protein